MEIIETREAVANRQSLRPFSIWETGKPELDPGYGGARVYQGALELDIHPKFRLSPEASFFAAGSCFAREIELALTRLGRVVQEAGRRLAGCATISSTGTIRSA